MTGASWAGQQESSLVDGRLQRCMQEPVQVPVDVVQPASPDRPELIVRPSFKGFKPQGLVWCVAVALCVLRYKRRLAASQPQATRRVGTGPNLRGRAIPAQGAAGDATMSRTGGGKEVLTTAAVAVAAGVGVAALAGLGLAGAFGVGVLGVTAAGNSFAQRRAKPPLQPGDVRRDAEGRIENWGQVGKAVQHGVSVGERRCLPALLLESACLLKHAHMTACLYASASAGGHGPPRALANPHQHPSLLSTCLPARLLQGIAPELRAELWPLLLGVFPRDSTQQERNVELERLRRQAGS